VDHRRELPPFAKPTLVEAAKNRVARVLDPKAKAVPFADIFTNYGSPWRGLATLKVFQSLGIDVVVSDTCADGRAAISQGLIATAAGQARHTAELLRKHIEDGRDVVLIEPSVLAMFRLDYRRLLTDAEGQLLLERLRDHSFDAVEYLWAFMQGTGLDAANLFPASRHPLGTRLFYHSHCQQKTVGSAPATEALLRAAGFDVATSNVECCGMAGSFGYKKEYHDLSMAVGQDLFQQVAEAESDGPRVLVATGTSCHEQLASGLKRQVFYPTELLAALLP
jgi:Fe-S oxidoreductase